jgi:DNA polymerase I-like protein with 3'-5' exonuclease and polymerase domains
MAIAGTLKYEGTEYLVIYNEQETVDKWLLVSRTNKKDLLAMIQGTELKFPVLNVRNLQFNSPSLDYILEGINIHKNTGKHKSLSDYPILDHLLSEIRYAKTYAYPDESILLDSVEMQSGIRIQKFAADDGRVAFSLYKSGKNTTYLKLSSGPFELEISSSNKAKFPTKLEYSEIKSKDSRKLTEMTVESLDYETLKNVFGDFSWYENEDGTLKKNYFPVRNIKEFETQVISPILKAINTSRSLNRKLVITLDVETTGLNMYNLSDSNPEKDRVVTVILSWEEDESALIFIDMKYFENMSIDYAMERLLPFVGEYTGQEIEYEERLVVKEEELTALHDGYTNRLSGCAWKPCNTHIVKREYTWLVGHNVMFDNRALLTHGYKTFWDDDTLQMSFTLNPKSVRGSNKLKVLLEKVFGIRAPELSDILGKGKEGFFREIKDLRVACLYGGSDTDNDRKLFFYLKEIMPPSLYETYRRQDSLPLNYLPFSEFIGLPIDEEFFSHHGKINKEDLEKMTEFLYSYVGFELDRKNKRQEIKDKFTAGLIDEATYLESLKRIKPNRDVQYKFKMSGNELRAVIYDILEYPIKVRTAPTDKHPEGQPALNKAAFNKWLDGDRSIPSTYMKEDLISADGKTKLIEKDKFNLKRYPVAYFLQQFRDILKDHDSYYQPIMEGSMEGFMHKSYALARIETRRIMNSLQTMKKGMKYGIVALEDHYLGNFDQAQAEPRIMVSRSGDQEEIKKYENPENDYHTENAARILGIPPHQLAKELRKIFKAITLGLPYGIGPEKMCGDMYKGQINQENLFKVRRDIEKWQSVNHAIYEKLESDRLLGLTRAKLTPEVKEFIAKTHVLPYEEAIQIEYGAAYNDLGFYRLFELNGVVGDRRLEGKIKRPSGNFPVQSLAAEIFRIILRRFYGRCAKEGIQDKIVWHMLIHDELVFSVHNSIHPFFLYKILHEECTIQPKGHTKYFIGINIGDSWGDTKKDENEAPVKFVERVIKAWDKGAYRDDDYLNWSYNYYDAKGKLHKDKGVKAYVLEHMHSYLVDRIYEEVKKIQPNCDTAPLNLKHIVDNFTVYTVRAYVTSHFRPNQPIEKGDSEDLIYQKHFETWMLKQFGEGKELLDLSGKVRKIYTYHEEDKIELADIIPMGEEFHEKDSNVFGMEEDWDFEDSTATPVTEYDVGGYVPYYDDSDEANEKILSRYKKAEPGESFSELILDKPVNYRNIKKIGNSLYLNIGMKKNSDKVKKFLEKFKADEGYEVALKTVIQTDKIFKIRKDTDLSLIDSFLSETVSAGIKI